MEALALYRQGRYPEALASAQQKAEVETAVLALLALGEIAEAQTLLEAWQPGTRSQRARRASVAEGRGWCWRDLFNTLLLEST
jgi:hypothetical protein